MVNDPGRPVRVVQLDEAGVTLPSAEPLEDETIAAIVGVTGGNFRFLHRLLTQMERILDINTLKHVTGAVVEAARKSLVIGQV